MCGFKKIAEVKIKGVANNPLRGLFVSASKLFVRQ